MSIDQATLDLLPKKYAKRLEKHKNLQYMVNNMVNENENDKTRSDENSTNTELRNKLRQLRISKGMSRHSLNAIKNIETTKEYQKQQLEQKIDDDMKNVDKQLGEMKKNTDKNFIDKKVKNKMSALRKKYGKIDNDTYISSLDKLNIDIFKTPDEKQRHLNIVSLYEWQNRTFETKEPELVLDMSDSDDDLELSSNSKK